jgi:HK97 gp10 family phage protein
MISAKVQRKGNAAEVLERIRAGINGPTTVKVGFIQGQAPADQVAIASYNEFGTSRIPERPFLRQAMAENRGAYQTLMRNDAKRIVSGEQTMRRTLDRLGLKAQGDVQQSIVDLRSPPNAPSTIKQKGSSNPLIDTGSMRQAVTFKVDT